MHESGRLMTLLRMALAAAAACGLTGSLPATAREVDDSYTVAQRFEQYKDQYSGITWPAVTLAEGQEILFDRSYKRLSDRSLGLDVFLPSQKRRLGTALVLVHGGAWRSGDKSHFYALASRLAGLGHTVILPEYRLAPEAGYPSGMTDAADALRWVHDNAAHFGIKPGWIAVGGASSGGQMAALLAYDARLRTDEAGRMVPVAALIDLDGVLDMTDPLALQFENAAGDKSPFAQWVGGSFESAPQTWIDASAAHHVSPRSPPTLILGSGIPRFTAGRVAVLAALKSHGTRTEVYDLVDAPHDFWLFEPWLTPTARRIDRFLRALLSSSQTGDGR